MKKWPDGLSTEKPGPKPGHKAEKKTKHERIDGKIFADFS